MDAPQPHIPSSQPPPGTARPGQEELFPTADGDRPPWSATTGLIGFLLAMLATILLIVLVGAFYVAAGFDDPADAASFEFVAIAAQSLALVGVTLAITNTIARPRARQFGFRPSNGSAIRWVLIVFFGYLFIAYLYSLLASPPDDDLPQELGANESTTLAIITGIFVIGVAPVVEEFFFRGFLYQAFRNRIGVWGAAVASGAIFGAIHFKPEFFVPLAALGVLLALLFQKTDSLWPCIAVHAINNALAFAVLL
jgi:membrane protease YdiL (CAAX protease family)